MLLDSAADSECQAGRRQKSSASSKLEAGRSRAEKTAVMAFMQRPIQDNLQSELSKMAQEVGKLYLGSVNEAQNDCEAGKATWRRHALRHNELVDNLIYQAAYNRTDC